MYRTIQLVLIGGLVGAALFAPAGVALADTPIGNGTPLSCSESSFDTALAGGGNLFFDCGGPITISLTHVAYITSNTTLDGGNAVTLTGNLSTQLIIVSNGFSLDLKNIILDQGYIIGNGGAIFNTGSLTLDHATIQNSIAGHYGGGIWTSGPVTIRNDSVLYNNTAGKNGGGLYEQNPRAVVIDNSTFSTNSAQDASTGVGGAIALASGAQLTFTGGSLISNLAVLDGGALDMAPNVTATLQGGVNISHNRTQAYGGAISNNGGILIMDDVDLEYNQVPSNTVLSGFGGAIDDEGALVLENSRVANSLGRFGGGVFVGGPYTPTAAITHTVFFNNNAGQLGGGLYTDIAAASISIEDSNFQFNKADYAGGAIDRINGHLNISRSSFNFNQAVNGGGLGFAGLPHADSGPYVEMRDSTVSGNLATGAGGGVNNSGLLDMFNVTLAGNDDSLFSNGTGAITRLQNDVLANSAITNCSGDTSTISSAGYNYATDTSCALSGFHDTHGSLPDVKLGALTNAGSFTDYRLPLAGSPLINAGGPGCSTTDQRYALRNGACDIGALEFDGLLPALWLPLVRR